MEQLISVIIPVYNTRPFLEKCVESVRNQSYQNLEILLMDDGSTDGSGELCDRLAEQDSRIRVLHRQNQGVSKARYDAVLEAAGEYTAFLDSDDWVDSDYIAVLYGALQEFSADCATCAHRVIESGREPVNMYDFENGNLCLSAAKTFEWIYYGKKCSTALCCKLFRTQWLREIQPSDLKLGEDSYICQLYLLRCKRIVHTGKVLYSYYQRSTSALHSSDGIRFYDYVRLYDMLEQPFLQSCPQAADAYYNKLLENNFVAFLHIAGRKEQYADELAHIEENIIKHRKKGIGDKRAEIRTRCACLLSFAGMDTVGRCYSLFEKIKS